MSNNFKKKAETVAQVLFTGSPKPLVDATEKRPQTGNGKATFKTASAAANAAREARDEAKKSETACIQYAKMCGAYIDADIANTRKLLAALQRNEKILIWCASISLGGFVGALVAALIFS